MSTIVCGQNVADLAQNSKPLVKQRHPHVASKDFLTLRHRQLSEQIAVTYIQATRNRSSQTRPHPKGAGPIPTFVSRGEGFAGCEILVREIDRISDTHKIYEGIIILQREN